MKTGMRKFVLLMVFAVTALISGQAETTSWIYIETEADPDLEIEAWMTQDYYWGGSFEIAPVEIEGELALEDWMTDNRYWK